jgi:hypothetical protein
MLYYVYKLIDNVGRFYFGSRKTKESDPYKDLGVKYFSSSKTISDIGFDQFNHVVLKVYDNFDDCYWNEQELIKQHIQDPLCLNRSYYDRDKCKQAFSMSGKKQTPEHIEKRIAPRRGKSYKRKTPFVRTENWLLYLERRRGNTPCSVETKTKISIAKTGTKDSVETRAKKSVSKKGKPANVRDKITICPNCGISGAPGNMARWHIPSCV